MAKETGVIIGDGHMSRYYRSRNDREELFVAGCRGDLMALRPEQFLAEVLVARGCKEIILFACPFDDPHGRLHGKSIKCFFQALPIPVYQTLLGTPVDLPFVSLVEFM